MSSENNQSPFIEVTSENGYGTQSIVYYAIGIMIIYILYCACCNFYKNQNYLSDQDDETESSDSIESQIEILRTRQNKNIKNIM